MPVAVTRSRRATRLGVVVLTALAVAACGSDEADDTTAESAPTTESAEVADGAAPEAEEDGDDVRIVQTVDGEVEVPASPDRIVTTHPIATQPLIELGIVPVGRGGDAEMFAYPEYWAQIEAIEEVSVGPETNVELIAELEPDLIFATNFAEDSELDSLREIAPVVVIGLTGPQRADWQGRAALIAEVVGREDELAALEEAFTERTEEVAGTYEEVLAENTFNVLDSFEAGSVSPYSSASMVGNILVPAGATLAPSSESEEVMTAESVGGPATGFSIEELGRFADGTVILHGSLPVDGTPSATQQALLDSSVFLGSPAAQAGQVYPIGKTTIAGYGDALALLDRFEAALAAVEGA